MSSIAIQLPVDPGMCAAVDDDTVRCNGQSEGILYREVDPEDVNSPMVAVAGVCSWHGSRIVQQTYHVGVKGWVYKAPMVDPSC